MPQVWLGEAVEIKPPTSIAFERRNGANVLLVGQDADAALGIMTTAAATLAAQSGCSDGRRHGESSPSITLCSMVHRPSRRMPPSGGRWPDGFLLTIQVLGPRGTDAGAAPAGGRTGQRRAANPDTSGRPAAIPGRASPEPVS